MQTIPRGTILLVAGAALLAVAAVHGLVNVPHLTEDLVELAVRPTLLTAVQVVLWFSVVAMIAFAALVLAGGVASMQGRPARRAPLFIVAGVYVAFGIVAFVSLGHSPHAIGYSALGALVGVGAGMRHPRELMLR